MESSFFGSAGEGGGRVGGGEREERKMGGKGGRGNILASDMKYVDFPGLPSTVAPPRVLRVSERDAIILCTNGSLSPHPSSAAKSLFDSATMSTGIWPYHGTPSIIAINMILAVAAGGTTAVIIAVWAQVNWSHETLGHIASRTLRIYCVSIVT